MDFKNIQAALVNGACMVDTIQIVTRKLFWPYCCYIQQTMTSPITRVKMYMSSFLIFFAETKYGTTKCLEYDLDTNLKG